MALYRGTGRYPECVAAATAARSIVSEADRKDIDSYAKTYAGYESDFTWLATAPNNSIIAPEKWVQPEILECMNRAYDLIETNVAQHPGKSGKTTSVSAPPVPAHVLNKEQEPMASSQRKWWQFWK